MAKKQNHEAKQDPESQSDQPVQNASAPSAGEGDAAPRKKLNKKVYRKELARLQRELVKLQEWIRFKGLKVVVIFEGRDAAGKGGVIKRITERLNPRVVRVVALPALRPLVV